MTIDKEILADVIDEVEGLLEEFSEEEEGDIIEYRSCIESELNENIDSDHAQELFYAADKKLDEAIAGYQKLRRYLEALKKA